VLENAVLDMAGFLIFLLIATVLLGAPAAIYMGWKGRLGGPLLVVRGMFAVSIVNYTLKDWHGNDGNPEAMMGAWLFGQIGIGIAAVTGIVAFLLSMGGGSDDFD
jgi:hypothetical protein